MANNAKSKIIYIVLGVVLLISVFIVGRMSSFTEFDNLSFFWRSTEKRYARKMETPLEELSSMIDGPMSSWYSLISSPLNEYTTYSEYLNAYPMGFYYEGTELYSTDAYINLHKATSEVLEAGFDVYTLLGSITPPDEIRVAHNELIACVQHEIDLMSSILDLLETGVPTEITSECRAFSSALDKVMIYVENHEGTTPTIKNKAILE